MDSASSGNLPHSSRSHASKLWDRIHQFGHGWVVWFGGREPAVLVSMLLLLAAGMSFVHLADEVSEGETHQFDRWLLRALRTPENPAIPVGPVWLAEVARDTTSLGGYGCLIFFTLIVTGYLWLDKKQHLALFLFASATSGYLLSSVLKDLFQRPRPDIVPHLDTVASTSFPSGHSMNAAIIYLTLGTLIATAVGRKRLKVYVIAVALFLTFAVGCSRVFLGVHYPTDVAAGWMAGLSWALLCWLAARFLQSRGQVEQPSVPPDEPKPDLEPHQSV
ncbi:phosphatase PAP2 family protein [Planctomicrobium piriforme]|uniref:Undecaprenyl-diphosphatase n=1 Tax=Planctomicrobium piriforme TaxID=1576369 RepID=A0A1I3F8D1_9PLAN|nr:phosphatase PAP2 family protein [Planctomicrobium piriforme]SFI07410.1 undecaprenyl-diphosphatase [Planctomicrobium piriforme]